VSLFRQFEAAIETHQTPCLQLPPRVGPLLHEAFVTFGLRIDSDQYDELIDIYLRIVGDERLTRRVGLCSRLIDKARVIYEHAKNRKR
jgi:hypothetical protein